MKRYAYLDEWKGFGIILIMMQHAFQYFGDYGAITSYVEGFHVTIFFLASGFLAWLLHETKRSFGTVVRKKAMSLLIPFFTFSIINSCLKLGVMAVKGQITKSVLKDEALQFFITGNGTVWFLSILFFVEILFEVIRRISTGKGQEWWFTATAVIGLGIPFLANRWITGPFGVVLKRSLLGYGFFIVGYFLARYGVVAVRRKLPTGIVLITAGILIWRYFGSGVNYFAGDFTRPVSSLLIGILSPLGFLLLFQQFEERQIFTAICRMFRYYGLHSLVVMVVHPILLMLVMYPFGSRINALTGIAHDLAALFLLAFLMLGEIPFIWIIEEYLPFMIGRKGKHIGRSDSDYSDKK